MKKPIVNITNDILKWISEIDEFKGAWIAIGNLAPDRLEKLIKIATIESVGFLHESKELNLLIRKWRRFYPGLTHGLSAPGMRRKWLDMPRR